MASEIKLPELGENVTGGVVVDIRVSAGTQVKEGDTLLEVEAGKSTVEVPAPSAGKITDILVKRGEEVQTGQVLFKLDASVRGDAGSKPSDQKSSPPKESANQPVPARTQTVAGDGARGKPPTPDRGARTAPQTTKLREAGLTPERIARREEDNREEEPAAEVAAALEERPQGGKTATEEPPLARGVPARLDRPGRLVPASPATRLLAREFGVELAQVRGSGPHGRVTPEDIKAYVRELAAGVTARPGHGVAVPALPDFSRWGEIEHRPLDTIRRETARQMSLAWSMVPHVTQHDQADITDLEAFRKAQPADGPRLTVTAFAIKASAIALREFPQFNSSLDVAHDQLVLKRYYHIGVAVDTERGLLVPVIRDVDSKSITQIAEELAVVADRARQRKLTADQMSGGTFTVTNLGGIGGTGFTPIVNFPEVAILGMSRSRLQPVVRASQVTPRLLMPLSLSYDHRVIDGAAAARFARRLAEMLENPLVMLLHA
jgi:pyruvate dehydrogenase E2 component (dihydrolipoamide acetyltransferase)